MTNWQTMKKTRIAANLTGVEMAEKVGICPERYYMIEAGKVNRPHPSTVRKLAAAFGVTPQQILGVEPWKKIEGYNL
jgi:transcriptional regulator with XRE-family HTH domain